jgi:ankyrin repeat protein
VTVNDCSGFTEIVLRLLAAGCPINAQSSVSGETALVLAAANGHADSTRSLLLAGADPLIRITFVLSVFGSLLT